jgi:hypothetical protein
VSYDLHLVGSIPYDTVEEVFTRFGGALGDHLHTMPDGEVGPRSHWISRVHYQVLALHPDIEVTRYPAKDGDVEHMFPRGPHDSWRFRVKDGITAIHFGDPGWRLGYARDALNSYFVFRTLREAGKIAKHLRFQVSIPAVASAVPPRIFDAMEDCEIVRAGYEEALKAELQTILDRIPHQDLAIQWDCATELQDAYNAIPGLPPEEFEARNIAPIGRLSPLIPAEVQLGFHLCFGTLGGWPRFEPNDLSGGVRLANSISAGAGRRVDWMHIPVLNREDEAFFAPLANLSPGGAKIYLGLLHNMDGLDARVAAAKKYLPDFGLGAYCGFGRMQQDELQAVLEDHLKAAKAG